MTARGGLEDRLGRPGRDRRRLARRGVVETVPFLAQVSLRLAAADAPSAPYPLPLEPNTAWEDGPRAALWLGPDEWLVLGPPLAGPEIVAELERALGGVHRSVVDVSANRVADRARRGARGSSSCRKGARSTSTLGRGGRAGARRRSSRTCR